MTYSVTVTVGRNVGSEPMAAESWDSFRERVADCLAMWCRIDVQGGFFMLSHSHGVGEWDGVPEDNYTVTAYGIERMGDAASVFESVQSSMAGYARVWEQDAIAVTFGAVALVSPENG